MKIKLLTLLLLAVAALTIGIATGKSKANVAAKNAARVSKSPLDPALPQTPGTIDGAVNPELIPDQVAYSLLFRLLSNLATQAEQGRIRAYIEQMNLGDADALLAVAKGFSRRVGVLDRRAQQIWEQRGPNLDARALAQLNDLEKRKEQIVSELVTSLPSRLGTDGMEKLRRHVNERVKRKTKIDPEHVHR